MSLPDYQIIVLSPYDGTVLTVIDQSVPYQIRYSRLLNDIGVIALIVPGESFSDALFPLDAFIEVYRIDAATGNFQREETYLARTFQRFEEDESEKLAISGVSLNHLLMRRFVDPADDPLEAGGYSTKAGAGDQVMREYALEQIGINASAARQVPNLTISTVPGVGVSAGKRLRYENLLEVMQELANQSGIDFEITRTSAANLLLSIRRIGTDKTVSTNYVQSLPSVLFDPQRGNLAQPSLTRDYKEQKNYVLVQGQGQGAFRQELRYTGSGLLDSPFNRIEFVTDSRNSEKGSVTALISAAFDALFENRPKLEFTFEVLADAGGATYRVDWDLGDKVSAQWRDTQVDLRITGIEIELTEQGESIALKTEQLNL